MAPVPALSTLPVIPEPGSEPGAVPADARRLAGRYRPLRLLKRGAGIETIVARDEATGAEVVVKTAPAGGIAPSVRKRLEHEAAVLREVSGPGLAPLLDFGREDGAGGDAVVFLVTAYVPGTPLDARLARDGPLRPREAVTVGCCVLGALAAAHARGVHHRDVKPANVIVTEGSPVSEATLVDFGFARSLELDAAIRDQPGGTVRYMAPEQAGLLDQGTDERSDLYSVGATLFECLTGRPAFEGATVGEVLRRHLMARPPGARGLAPAVPRALDEVVARLLRIDPRERYQSAEAARIDLAAIGRGLDAGVADPEVEIGAHDRRAALAEPAFVGRAEELRALDAEIARAQAGHGGLVLLEAPSGGGKTRLLDELALRSAARGARVLRGCGVDATAPRPFEALAGVVRGVAAAARSEPETAAALRERLGPHREAAAAALPELGPVLEPDLAPGATLGLEAHGEARTIAALSALLDALGAEGRPAVVLLDDCQWADDLTVRLLRAWSGREERRRGEEARHATVVVSFRQEEVPPDHPLRALAEAPRRIAVRPFGRAEVRRLAESMAGPLPDEALDVLAGLAGGNPFFAAAVLEGMVEGGALVAGEGGGFRVEPEALAEVRLSRRAAAVLARRLERLPGPALRLLEVGALLGKEFDLGLAEDLLGETAPGVDGGAALEEARRRRIVWTDAPRARCAFAHDRLREALLERLAGEERRDLHRRAAERIEALDRGRVFELAYHFDGAALGARALPYALAAAERARARHALEVAERYYRIAERGADAVDAPTRRRIAEGLADVLALRLRFDEALGRYEAARPLSESVIAEAQIEGKIGELEMKRGRMEPAVEAFARALRLLGERVPAGAAGFRLRLGWEALVQVGHTLLPRLFTGRGRPERAEPVRLAARLLNRLSLAYHWSRGTVPMIWAHIRELNLAQRYPRTVEEGRAEAEHGFVLAQAIPSFARPAAYAARGLATLRRLGDAWGEGHAQNSLGIALLFSGRFEEAIAAFQEAERVVSRVGDLWELGWARRFRAMALYRSGDLRGAVEIARRSYESSVGVAADITAVADLWIIAKATDGRGIARAMLDGEDRRPRDHATSVQSMLQVRADWLLAEGRPGEAAAALEEADRVVRTHGLRSDLMVPIRICLAAALREEAARSPPCDPRRRYRLLRRAARAARRGLRQARSFRNNLPHALREMALAEAARDRPRRARRLLDESLAQAERQGQRYERAKTLAARGEAGIALGWPGAAEDAESGRRALRELRAGIEATGDERRPEGPASISLADRLGGLIEAGRKIATAVTKEAILGAAREAALSLLRAERCAIVEDAPSDPEVEATSRTAVERALRCGRPVVLAPGLDADVPESAVLAGVRSVLAAPILVGGRAVACLCATHRQVAGLFGEEEERFAEFVSALAGAALESAEGNARNRQAAKEIGRLSEALAEGHEDERRRLALALHDGTGQLLTALGLRLDETARQASGAGAAGLATRLGETRALVDRLLAEVRCLAQDLRPPALDNLGLAEALADLAEGLASPALAIDVRVGPDERGGMLASLAPDASVNLFRIAQAALANVARHAHAGRAIVTLAAGDAGAVRLDVEDDGCGFDPAALDAGAGIGLIGMRERAAWLGGTFDLDAAPGRGTRIRVEVPVVRPESGGP